MTMRMKYILIVINLHAPPRVNFYKMVILMQAMVS